MPTSFASLRQLYANSQITELIKDNDGIYWLKLRSISRPEQLRQLCTKVGLACEGIAGRQLLEYVYQRRPSIEAVHEFIATLYERERSNRRANEDYLVSQLYQMKVFDWGGLYQNSLEQTIVNSYVKKITNWEALNSAIDNELQNSLRGYVQCSWYNHWSSILIEDIFKDHPTVIPAIGLVKMLDFFIHDFPFDLKVTYFPDGYMKELRKSEGLRPEFTELKAFCRIHNIWFDRTQSEGVLFPELLAKIEEHPSPSAQDFILEFRDTRARLIHKTLQDPTNLKIWLYENQGVRRFDAANRFFLILIDANNMEESWKLKRNKPLLANAINSHLDMMQPNRIEGLKLHFTWQDRRYETYSDVLLIIVNN